MNLDETLAEALHRTADRVTIGPSPVEATVHRGLRTRRRRRTTGIAVAVLAAATVVPAWSLTSHSGTPTDHPVVPAVQIAAQTMAPGQQTTLPSGTRLWLTAQGVSFLAAGESPTAADTVKVPDPVRNPVTARSSTAGTTALWVGVYNGPGRPTKITLDIAGEQFTATVLTLPGSPGWVAFAVEDPRSIDRTAKPEISAYAADGTLLFRGRF